MQQTEAVAGYRTRGQEHVECVHVDPQIREQEFGNFQDPGLTSKAWPRSSFLTLHQSNMAGSGRRAESGTVLLQAWAVPSMECRPGLTSSAWSRRPNAESSADVFDRVTQFWDKLFEDNGKGLLTEGGVKYDMCLMVTHGLTIRLMLMCLFKWSVETFASVWNLGNCEHVTLKKNIKEHKYEILGHTVTRKTFTWHCATNCA